MGHGLCVDDSVVAVAKGQGVEVVVNEMSRRETRTALLFKQKRRVVGDLAEAGPSQLPESAIQQVPATRQARRSQAGRQAEAAVRQEGGKRGGCYSDSCCCWCGLCWCWCCLLLVLLLLLLLLLFS